MKNCEKIVLNMLRHIPLIVCIIFMALYLLLDMDFSVDKFIDYTPENPIFAAVFVVVLYSFKSLTVFFPITILNILGGFIFSPPIAILVNSLGVICEVTIPYWIGRSSGRNFADKISVKHPKIAETISIEEKGSPFFKSFFLRIVAILPEDAVSMYLGAIKLPFGVYLAGSFFGTFPSMVTATLIGTNITDPTSPMFWISVILNVFMSAISIVIYYFGLKHKRKEQSKEDEIC